MLTVKEVKTARQIKEFINFPLKLYKNCPYFVPPLYGDEKKLLKSVSDTPNIESIFFIAEKDGKTVGRIQGIIQKQYNDNHSVRQVRFTRFDCIDDQETASRLFSAVENWGAENAMNEICGPLGCNDLEREGLLIEGFSENSTFEEQYNYEYYSKLIENSGFTKDVDWLEFELTLPEEENEILNKVSERALLMNKLHIADKSVPKKKYIQKYRDGFFECLDECYKNLYGTVPISKDIQDDLVNQFMLIINKKYLTFICDENDKVVGFGLCFPGIGDAIKKSGGRLTPLALIKLLKLVKNPKVLDLGLVAVHPDYQFTGINAVLVKEILDMLKNSSVIKAETNLNLETNTAVISQWKYFTTRQHKRRRSYIKKIGE